MNYKFLKLMSNSEIRILLADYGNATGADINNFLVREMISMIKNNQDHSILIKLERYLKKCSIEAINNEIIPFISDYVFCLDDEKIISIIRENKNRIYEAEARKKDHVSFIGNCIKHGHTQFSIRGKYRYCHECYQTGMSKVIFNPVQNLILKLFIDKSGISFGDLSRSTGIKTGELRKYYKEVSAINSKNWDVLSEYILNSGGNCE